MIQADEWDESETALAIVADPTAFQIIDAESYEMMVEFRRGCSAKIAQITAHYKPIKQGQDAAKRVTLDMERKDLAPYESGKKIAGEKLDAYDMAKRREQAIAEARAAEDVRRLEALRPPPAPGEVRPPVVVPAASVPVPKVAGFSFSTHYTAVVTDKMALIQAVAAGNVSADVLSVVGPVADDWARQEGPQTKAAEAPGTVVPMPGIPGLGLTVTRRPRG